MENLANRLKQCREEMGLTQIELAKKARLKNQSIIGSLESGHRKNSRHIPAIAEALGINALWLAEGRGPMRLTDQQPAVLTNIEQIEIDALRKDVPLISWVQAGDWCETINNIELGDAEDWLWCPVKHSGKTFALRVSGVSMFNPDPYAKHSFKDGDIIYVDPTRQPINNSFVVVRLENENKATFKQLIIEGNHRFLRAINPDWPEKIIEIKNNAVICGVVIYKGSEV
nr:LexA family transcriptional regulator [Nitrosomonas nitrosa]